MAKSRRKLESTFKAQVLLRWGHHPRIMLWPQFTGQAWVKTTDGARPIQAATPGCPDIIGYLEWCSLGLCGNVRGGWRSSIGQTLFHCPVTVATDGVMPAALGREFDRHRSEDHRALFLGIETKSPTGTMRESQLNFQARLTGNHGLYIRAKLMSDVDAVLVPLVGEP